MALTSLSPPYLHRIQIVLRLQWDVQCSEVVRVARVIWVLPNHNIALVLPQIHVSWLVI